MRNPQRPTGPLDRRLGHDASPDRLARARERLRQSRELATDKIDTTNECPDAVAREIVRRIGSGWQQ